MRWDANRGGAYVVLRPSDLLGGTEVFVVPKGEELPEYIGPCDEYPNGDDVFTRYHRAWMMEIPDSCEC
jgi:hypothetical protein